MSFFEKLKEFKNAVYGKNYTCYLCRAEVFDGACFCEDCAERLRYNLRYCERCGRIIPQRGYCASCRSRAPVYDRARSVFVYEGYARDAVLRFKTGEPWLAKAFVEEGMPVIERELMPFDLIVPVPMLAADKRQRGYNQAELLAEEISERTGVGTRNLFRKVKKTLGQKELTAAERRENLRGAFRLQRGADLKGKTVLLTDDAMTTGTTAETLCGMLRAAGAEKVLVFTVASIDYGAARNIFAKRSQNDLTPDIKEE